jgi:kynureninase
VREDLLDKFQPAITGWSAHAHPFDFKIGPIDYAKGIMRWMHGTPAVAPLYQCLPGYEMIQEIGVPRIRSKSMRQTARIIEKARAMGMRLNSPLEPQRRGGSVVVDVADGHRVCQELIRRKYLVDYRPGAGVRLAPHFYTTDEECDATIEEMAAIVAAGAPR